MANIKKRWDLAAEAIEDLVKNHNRKDRETIVAILVDMALVDPQSRTELAIVELMADAYLKFDLYRQNAGELTRKIGK